jgi:hypothetical protein
MSATTQKFVKWAPRALAVAYALFLSLFALDVWGMGDGFWNELAAFLMHLMPVYIVVLALIIAWKWPRAGGLLFIGLAVVFTWFFGWWEIGLLLALALPLVIIGLLFLAGGRGNAPQLKPGT